MSSILSSINLNELDKLPREIIEEHIWPYISPYVKLWLNKSYYIKYHHHTKKYISEDIYDSYVRFIIRNDYSFIIERLLYDNFDEWIKILRYPYKDTLFNNYIFFLSHFAVENESTKSNNLINYYLRIAGYEKKWHKKNSVKYIRWSN
jgi:hypothetical protein